MPVWSRKDAGARVPGAILVAAGSLSWSGPVEATTCTSYGSAALVAECQADEINESSGIAWSRTRRGIWFSHNDAGGVAVLHAFDLTGDHVDTHVVTGADFQDWEDLSYGPCPAGTEAEHCLYIADVGDNARTREEVQIYAIAEPGEGEDALVVATWRLTWPDAPRDSEAVAVHPCSGRIYMVSKERMESEHTPVVVRAPLEPTGPDASAELEVVTELPVSEWPSPGAFTGADWSPAGDRFVARNYDSGWEWVTDPDDPDAHWGEIPTRVMLHEQGQGESIAYRHEGGLLTTTEGVPMLIAEVPCVESEEFEGCAAEVDWGPIDTGGADTSEDTSPAGDSGDSGPGDDGASGTGDDGGTSTGDGDSGGGALMPADPGGCGCNSGAAGLWWLLPVFLARRRGEA